MKKRALTQMKKETPEVFTPHSQPPSDVPVQTDAHVEEAAKSVYKRYGRNLSQFFRDAYAAEARKREKAANEAHDLEACA
jgi:hypothetical protein